ncbi:MULTISPECIES: glycosyltransferase family 4 protein [unclassified Bradyrhizobium]|uniref:glycosyltransferase family 4 protein n=1 Tax=Bradyrhizobium sp. BRP23 TaxID=2793820 RepID=UPI001CD304D7
MFQLVKLGGKERDCLAVARFLLGRGHVVTIVTTAVDERLSLPCPVVLLDAAGQFNHVRSLAFSRAALAWAKVAEAEVLLAFERIPGADAHFAADGVARRGGQLGWLPRYRTRRALEEGVFGPDSHTKLFFLTERQRDEYAKVYRFDQARCIVLPLILHEERIEAAKARVAQSVIRSALNIPLAAITAVAVAVDPLLKGVDRVLAAAVRHPDLHVVIVGSEKGWLKRQIKRLGLKDRTRLVPYTSDVMRLLRAADFLVHPARVEAAGQVILESLLAGVPAIVSDVCGYASEVVRSGAGLVVKEPITDEALAGAIQDAIERLPALRAAAATESHRLIRTQSLWLEAIAQELEVGKPPRKDNCTEHNVATLEGPGGMACQQS